MRNDSKYLVVYADDDQDDLELITEAFGEKQPDISLVTKNDGSELILYLNEIINRNQFPCLIILDINMPKLNGIDTLRHIRAIPELRNVPVVLYSTSSSSAEIRSARLLNAAFLTKPVSTRQLGHIVKQLINFCTDDVKQKLFQDQDH